MHSQEIVNPAAPAIQLAIAPSNSRSTSIDLSPIPDLIDLNNTPRIVNRIDNTVIPLL